MFLRYVDHKTYFASNSTHIHHAIASTTEFFLNIWFVNNVYGVWAHCSLYIPKSLMCFSRLSFSSCDDMLARCIPWNRQYCAALYQFAYVLWKENLIEKHIHELVSCELQIYRDTHFICWFHVNALCVRLL